MAALTHEVQSILNERFGKDSLLALATSVENIPHVRAVDAYYENGSFYVITHALSGKMQQIARNPTVALCGDWFTAAGTAENMGWFLKPENQEVADKLKKAFAAWIDNGHNNFADENTIILRIRLTHGVLFSNGTRYDIDFLQEETK